MAYLKINDIDFSHIVNQLKVNSTPVYTSLTNAAGNTVIDYINTKREIEVGIIPLDAESTKELITLLDGFNVSLSFLNPKTNTLEENVACIVPETAIDYYSIQINNVSVKAFTVKFIEL